MFVYRMPPLSQLAYIIRKRIASTIAVFRRSGAYGTSNWEIRRDFAADRVAWW
jgi:hypothetical protein